MILVAILYLYLGAKANSFIKHNVFGLYTAYVFSLPNFIMDKIIWAGIFGFISIPVAFVLWLFGVGRNR